MSGYRSVGLGLQRELLDPRLDPGAEVEKYAQSLIFCIYKKVKPGFTNYLPRGLAHQICKLKIQIFLTFWNNFEGVFFKFSKILVKKIQFFGLNLAAGSL